jgi:hypothetical protein
MKIVLTTILISNVVTFLVDNLLFSIPIWEMSSPIHYIIHIAVWMSAGAAICMAIDSIEK